MAITDIFENLAIPVAVAVVMIYLFLRADKNHCDERKKWRKESRAWRKESKDINTNTTSVIRETNKVIKELTVAIEKSAARKK